MQTETEEKASGPNTNGRNFLLNDFEGPLDLLLFLIKKNEVSIYDIPIATITEQFLAVLNSEEKPGLDNLTEFYSLAATLLYIKSRMLLPVEVDLSEEIDDPRQDLVEKLIEYQKYKKLSELMEQKELEAEWSLERKKIQRPLPFSDTELWDEIDVWDLLKSFSVLIGDISSERIIDLYEEVSINEKTVLIQELLDTRDFFSFHDLITRKGSTLDIVCAFLALLEAVKFRMICILQHRLFGDIQIKAYHKRSEDGTESGS
ncbi:MAG: segregation/condensation protein A [Spirochaetes bacterium]|nr:segregation/condensation protein A [Spirochaetota bacterium]